MSLDDERGTSWVDICLPDAEHTARFFCMTKFGAALPPLSRPALRPVILVRTTCGEAVCRSRGKGTWLCTSLDRRRYRGRLE